MSKEESISSNWIGERIRETRKTQGISQEALAFKAWLPVVTLAKIEQWKIFNPGLQSIWKITIALGLGLDEFVQGHEPESISK